MSKNFNELREKMSPEARAFNDENPADIKVVTTDDKEVIVFWKNEVLFFWDKEADGYSIANEITNLLNVFQVDFIHTKLHTEEEE